MQRAGALSCPTVSTCHFEQAPFSFVANTTKARALAPLLLCPSLATLIRDPEGDPAAAQPLTGELLRLLNHHKLAILGDSMSRQVCATRAINLRHAEAIATAANRVSVRSSSPRSSTCSAGRARFSTHRRGIRRATRFTTEAAEAASGARAAAPLWVGSTAGRAAVGCAWATRWTSFGSPTHASPRRSRAACLAGRAWSTRGAPARAAKAAQPPWYAQAHTLARVQHTHAVNARRRSNAEGTTHAVVASAASCDADGWRVATVTGGLDLAAALRAGVGGAPRPRPAPQVPCAASVHGCHRLRTLCHAASGSHTHSARIPRVRTLTAPTQHRHSTDFSLDCTDRLCRCVPQVPAAWHTRDREDVERAYNRSQEPWDIPADFWAALASVTRDLAPAGKPPQRAGTARFWPNPSRPCLHVSLAWRAHASLCGLA